MLLTNENKNFVLKELIFFFTTSNSLIVKIHILSHKYLPKKEKKNEVFIVQETFTYTYIYISIIYNFGIESPSLFLFLVSLKKNRGSWDAKPPFFQSPHPSLCV